jgi:F0F1-type ATP synthase assembly protein I
MRDDGTNERPSGGSNREISWNQAVLVGGLAISIPGLLLGPPIVGYWLDEWLGTTPYLLVLMLIAGFVGTAFDIWVILKRIGMVG